MLSSYSLWFILAIAFVTSQSKPEKPFFSTLEALCNNTFYSKTCFVTLSPLIDSEKSYDSQFLYNKSVQLSINEVSRVLKNFLENGELARMFEDTKEEVVLSALKTCRYFLSLAIYNLNLSLATSDSVVTSHRTRADFRTWLSAAGANLQTCIDESKLAPDEMRKMLTRSLDRSTRLVTTSLAIMSKINDDMSLLEETSIADAANTSGKLTINWEPTWLSSKDRKTLDMSKQEMKPDVVVAADGSGNYKTITEAIKAVPPNSNERFVIHVKKGVYRENVIVGREKWNVMMYGDGMHSSIVSSNRSYAAGFDTMSGATFAVYGKGFVAKNMGFQNTAGPAEGQAVALLSASDLSVFYECLIDGYQDTLFTQIYRQLYEKCDIYGTIDFIFGDSAVVIQNSNILVKRPSDGQSNVITAQGKTNPHSNTGISIQKCNIEAAENLAGVDTFLGRPWKDYSTTIIMESQLGSLIHPEGWTLKENTDAPDTVLFVEWENTGPGADTKNRVEWKGLKVNNTQSYASNFTVKSFINGDQWIPTIGVPFQ